MINEITYVLFENGLGYHAVYHGAHVGEITFVRAGADKLIIDYTGVAEKYRNINVGLNLVRAVCNLARGQGRKVITICPFARAMFNRHPEFDDVRLMNSH